VLLEGFYEVVKQSDEEAVVQLSDASHPIFQAHFPDNPIMPGFMHLDIIEDVFSLEITTVKKAKYSAIVEPSSELTYTKEHNKFKVYCKDNIVATLLF